ncbi:MAG TPA: ABC transporter permease [Mycobacteriales bacterium]|nr:ABC transporter permease [Mycobacteriales bacterium]
MTETQWRRAWAVLGSAALLAFLLWVLAETGWDGVVFVQYAVAGLGPGAAAALIGVGIVLTYEATGVFNFAFGPMATLAAYLDYAMITKGSLPIAVSVLLTVVVAAPLLGAGIERFVFRPLQLRQASTSEQLLATIAVFAVILGAVVLIWGAGTRLNAPLPFGSHAFHVGSFVVSSSTIGNVGTIAVCAAAVTAMLRYTTLGREIRAVVDRRQLAELAGIRANRVATIAWAIGAVFAALAGVMEAPLQGLAPFNLTLLILETFAVVIVARLRSVKLAIIAGLGIGVLQSLMVRVQGEIINAWQGLQQVEPYLFVLALPLFLVIWRDLDEAGADNSTVSLVSSTIGRRRRRNRLVLPGAGAAVVLVALSTVFDYQGFQIMQQLLATAVIFLSIVAITGFSGHLTLGQAAFAGLGALLTAKLSNGAMPYVPQLNPILAMLLSATVVMLVGLATGFPVLRRRGLFLGLATLALNLVVYFMIFQNAYFLNGTSFINRPNFFGVSLTGDKAFYLYELVVLAVALLVTSSLRSGRLGRILAAMRDAPTGAESIGINMRRYKLFIFGASAFLAAIGGSLLAQQSETFNPDAWSPIISLFWFLAVVFAGLSYLSGAVLAAGLTVGLDHAVGQSNGSYIVIGVLTLFTISFLRGGVVGWVLSRGRRNLLGGLQRQYAEASARVATGLPAVDGAPPEAEPSEQWVPSEFAERLLAGSRR